MSKIRNRATGVAAVGLLAGALGACGGSGGSTSAAASDVQAPQTQASLAAQAAKEGKVVWYTTFVSSQISPIVADFEHQYPQVKVQPLRLSADQLPARVLSEQRGGKYSADVISGDATQVSQLLNSGALEAYDAPDQPPLPAGLQLPKGHQGVVYLNTTVIAYNPTAVKAAGLTPPSSWQALTQPQWKGKFSIDPGAVNFYQSEISALGQTKALALMKALGNNHPQLVTSHTEALTQVEQGEPLATATAYGYLASKEAAKDHSGIAFVNVSPLPSALNLVDVAKNAPDQAAAKLFLGWLESQSGQQDVVNVTNQTSLRSDVHNDPSVWNPATWKPAWADPDPSSSTYDTELQQYQSALHDAS